MRFCMVTTFYPPFGFGGGAAYVRALSKALVQRGHHVEVAHCADAFRLLRGKAASKQAPAANEQDEEGIKVHHLSSPLGPLSPLITQQMGHPGLKAHRLRAIVGQDF